MRRTSNSPQRVTPGTLLSQEFLEPMGISQYRLAKEIGVPAQRIGDIVMGKRSVTADTDLRLCRFFGLSNGYWLRAQAAHDTKVAERRIGAKLANIRPWALAMRESSPPYRVHVRRSDRKRPEASSTRRRRKSPR